jgi:hypothetical protein
MKKLFRSLLTITLLLIPSAVLAADLEITCYPTAKPSINMSGGTLFDIQNFVPGQTSTKKLKVVNTDTANACKISFKGEGSSNTLTNNIHIAFSGIYGNIVDGKATSSKNLSDFLDKGSVQVANLGPGETVERDLILTLNKDAGNDLAKKRTNFDIRVISEWGPGTTTDDSNGNTLGESTKRTTAKTSNKGSTDILGTGGPQEESEVKGVDECEAKSKLLGYIYVDRNKNGERDERERVLPDISVKIYVEDENGDKRTIKDLTTDEQGYWEIELCAGKYFVEIDRDTLPNNTDLADNILDVTLTANDTEYTLDIGVNDTRNFWELYWPWILLAILILLSVLYLILKRRKVSKLLKQVPSKKQFPHIC